MCADEICQYADFKLLFVQFLKHHIELSSLISRKRIRFTIASQYWHVKQLELELDGIRDGYQIFYDCLKETQEKYPAHGIIIERLEQEG